MRAASSPLIYMLLRYVYYATVAAAADAITTARERRHDYALPCGQR